MGRFIARLVAINGVAMSHRTKRGVDRAGSWLRSYLDRTSSSRSEVPVGGATDGGLPPEFSARTTFTQHQRLVVAAVTTVVGVGLIASPIRIFVALIAVTTAAYLAMFAFRTWTFWRGFSGADMVTVSDEDARREPEQMLPVYTILVPAYHEPAVMARLIAALDALEYPRSRLDIKLLLEADDDATIASARSLLERARGKHRHVEICLVPYSEPRTKPKACLYGLSRARGSYVTIYDAEDRPDPLQLRRAVVAFSRLPDDVACLQAQLSYHNAEQNLLTKWFTVEYAMWFSQLLPGLERLRAPVPLGGTSNHFRRGPLEAVGAWDPYNVTEDADLGVRLHRGGYRTRVLDSVTLEEANSDFVNWVKQRSRWYKGYMQTWLVHMRDPRRLWRELGPVAFIGFNLFVAGTPLLALLNPVFWTLAIAWFAFHPTVIVALFPAFLYYIALFCFLAGNFMFLYGAIVTARSQASPNLVRAAVLFPVYWLMMSIAAIKAVVQLVSAPSFWEKTTHGLDVPRPVAPTQEPGRATD